MKEKGRRSPIPGDRAPFAFRTQLSKVVTFEAAGVRVPSHTISR
jgi:hypothetical protein